MRLLVALLLVAMVGGCAGSRYEALPIESLAPINGMPADISGSMLHYDVNLTIMPGARAGNYTVSGEARPTKIDAQSYSSTNFVLYLCKAGHVIDHVVMRTQPQGGGPIKLYAEFFTPNEFDGATIRYYVQYRRAD